MYAKFGCGAMLRLIVCLVSQIGPRIRISDNGRHDTDKVQLFHGVIGDGCRELNRELYKL